MRHCCLQFCDFFYFYVKGITSNIDVCHDSQFNSCFNRSISLNSFISLFVDLIHSLAARKTALVCLARWVTCINAGLVILLSTRLSIRL